MGTWSWHDQILPDDPPCRRDEWRQKDRHRVLAMRDMDNQHLGHAIRFAREKPQHAGKLGALLNEQARRMLADVAAVTVEIKQIGGDGATDVEDRTAGGAPAIR